MTSTDLRQLADFLDERPKIAAALARWDNNSVKAWFYSSEEFHAACAEFGAGTKEGYGSYLRLSRVIGGLTFTLIAEKEVTCKKVVTTKLLPAVHVDEHDIPESTEETVEWVCPESFLEVTP